IGPRIVFGPGSETVALLGGGVFRITPLAAREAWNMVKGICGLKLLDGYRNMTVRRQKTHAQMRMRVSQLADEVPAISEMDFNPVKVYEEGKGAEVLDVRIMVRR